MRKLKTASLMDVLREMEVGEICLAPDECRPHTVTVACSQLKKEGYFFQTSTKTGVQTVTRIK